MTDHRKLIDDLFLLCQDALDQMPSGSRGLLTRQIARLQEQYDAMKRKRVACGPGAQGYWKNFRETQQFEFDFRDEDTEIVIGVDAAAKRACMRLNTFRQMLASGRGTFTRTLQEDDVDKIVTITRLTTK